MSTKDDRPHGYPQLRRVLASHMSLRIKVKVSDSERSPSQEAISCSVPLDSCPSELGLAALQS